MKKPLDKGGAVEEGLLCPMFATDALLRGLCCMLRDVYKKSLGRLYLVSRLVILFSQIGRMMMTSKNRREKPGKEM